MVEQHLILHCNCCHEVRREGGTDGRTEGEREGGVASYRSCRAANTLCHQVIDYPSTRAGNHRCCNSSVGSRSSEVPNRPGSVPSTLAARRRNPHHHNKRLRRRSSPRTVLASAQRLSPAHSQPLGTEQHWRRCHSHNGPRPRVRDASRSLCTPWTRRWPCFSRCQPCTVRNSTDPSSSRLQ